jgi:anti-sigma factor RsiW
VSRLTCKQLVELVTEYLEGALTPADTAKFEAHVSKCEGCSAYLEQMRKTIQLAGRLKEQDIEPAARNRLLTAFREWRAGAG